MTHEEEYENFVGSEERDPSELCRRCRDYPCSCMVDDLMLGEDWDAEIDAQAIRNSESPTPETEDSTSGGGTEESERQIFPGGEAA